MHHAVSFLVFASSLLLHACLPAPAPGAAPPPLRIGVVTSPGPGGEGTFNQLAIAGARRAAEAGEGQFDLREAASARQIEEQLRALAAEGYGHLVAVGPPAADATALLADRRRDLTFSIVDFSFDPALPNAQGLIFREDQAAYLAGALAGMVSESGTVGVAAGRDTPRVRKYVNGFAQGARAACPACRVLSRYVGQADDAPGGEAAAEALIAAGADVILGVDGQTGEAALRLAAQRGIYVIGAETDAYLTLFDGGAAPGAARVLTSAVKRVDVAVAASAEARLRGAFAAGTAVFDAASGGVGLAPFHQAEGVVSAEVRERLSEIEAGLAQGTIETGVSQETGRLLDR